MNVHFRFSLCAVMIAVASTSAFLGAATQDTILAEGIRCHDEVQLDPVKNIARGKELLGSIKDKSPVALAYYGSIITQEASLYADDKNAIKALSLLSEGTGFIDDSIKSSPDLEDLRFLRMINSYEISVASPLNRFKEMKTDIDWLESKKASLDPSSRGTLELYKGLYFIKAHRLEQALASFDACIEASPKSPEAAEAEKQLALYSE